MRAGVPVLILMKSFLLEAIFALGTAAAIAIPGTMYFAPAVIDRFSNWIVAPAAVILAVVTTRRLKLPSIYSFRLIALPALAGYVNLSLLYLLFGWSPQRSLVAGECPGLLQHITFPAADGSRFRVLGPWLRQPFRAGGSRSSGGGSLFLRQ